uniref:ATP-binding cassette domain-containing protein n=1 Tax=Lachnoclostridium phocaeense TaxID=1871021 RepID=UPI0026DB0060|nr:ATP-binding cassette domain-containing protein [Lachnoclostridium phocaeense]
MERNNVSIFVSSLKKRYKDREVLRDLTFSVPAGTIYALLGSNGAGKTTTVRILTTQLRPDGGTARVRGLDVTREPEKVHHVISVTGQFSCLDESLTGTENLLLMGRLRHLAAPVRSAVRLLEYFDLSSHADRRVSGWSGGMKRKLDIAMSLVGSPDVLFLDEPTTGLDPQSRLAMWQIVRRLRDGGMTVLLTTQHLEEAEQLADQIGILSEGKILAEGTPARLKSLLPRGAVRFAFYSPEDLERAASLLGTPAGKWQTSSHPEECALTVFTDGRADTLGELFRHLREGHISVRKFSELSPSLEDVFLTMIKEEKSYGNNKAKL